MILRYTGLALVSNELNAPDVSTYRFFVATLLTHIKM